MPQFTFLYGARQLVTLHGPACARRGADSSQLGIIENGSVLLRDGAIYAVGTTRRLENLKEAREALLIDVSGCVVMPGLVDPDFNVTLGAHRGSRASTHFHDEGLALLRACLQHGTLSAVLQASSGANEHRSQLSLLRHVAKLTSTGVDTVRTWHIPQAPGADHEAEFREVFATASRRRLIDSVSLSSEAFGGPVSDWITDLLHSGLPFTLKWNGGNPELLKAALEQVRPLAVSWSSALTVNEVDILAQSSSITLFAPGAEVGRATGLGMRQTIDAGGAIALSSGHHPVYAPGFSMQMAISLAVMHGRLTDEEAIAAATVNAAYAVGRGAAMGTLERGKRGNVIVLTIADYRDIARQFGINHVATVLSNGEVVYNRGRWRVIGREPPGPRVRTERI